MIEPSNRTSLSVLRKIKNVTDRKPTNKHTVNKYGSDVTNLKRFLHAQILSFG